MRNLGLVVSSLVVSLLLGEAAMRLAVAVLHRYPIVMSDEVTGWHARPDLRNVDVSANGGHFVIDTDAEGHRALASPEPAGADEPAVVIVGDSFAFGQSVADSETFAQQLSRLIKGRRIVNLGVLGWGPDQELLDFDRYLARHPGEKISDVVVLTYENDFRDVQRTVDPRLGYSKPHVQLTAKGLDLGAYRRPLVDRMMDDSRLLWILVTEATSMRPEAPVVTDRGLPLVDSCVDAIRQAGMARGARVHLFAHRLLKRPSTVSAPVWQSFLSHTGAVDITDALVSQPGPDPLSYDHAHWSREGNKRAAMLIAQKL